MLSRNAAPVQAAANRNLRRTGLNFRKATRNSRSVTGGRLNAEDLFGFLFEPAAFSTKFHSRISRLAQNPGVFVSIAAGATSRTGGKNHSRNPPHHPSSRK